jgi:dihydrofolate synthase/folylpolyglutamate synthase
MPQRNRHPDDTSTRRAIGTALGERPLSADSGPRATSAVSASRYPETLAHLYGLRRFGLRPGLEVMQALMAELDHPERSFKSIHVTGSKGKGSVSAIAASILSATGTRVALYTSPHLQSYRERIRVGDDRIPPAAVVKGVERVSAATRRLEKSGGIDREPTFFEVTTAVAFDWFRTQKVPWAVVEVGLGGRLDSTHVINAPVGVITTIELEHQEILGPTLTDIASEKVAILHPGMRGVIGTLPDEALRVVNAYSKSQGIPLWHLGREIRVGERELFPTGQRFPLTTPDRSLSSVELSLLGSFQATNAALALAAVDAFLASVGQTLPEATLRKGLEKARWRGRLERVAESPDLYLDVAHTPESAHAVAESMAEISPFEDPEENVLLFGCLAGKRAAEILDRLSPLAHTVVLVPVRSDRSASLGDLRRAAHGQFPRIVVAPSAADGLRLARAATSEEGFTLAVGSDYLVGDILNALEGTPPGEPDLSDPVGTPPPAPTTPARTPRG